MSNLEQSEDISLDEGLRNPQLKKTILNRVVSLLTENFDRNNSGYASDVELLERASNSKREISGRTSILMEKVLSDYIGMLKEQIIKLQKLNTEGAKVQINMKKDLIRMIEGNCLNSLDEINNDIIFPPQKKGGGRE